MTQFVKCAVLTGATVVLTTATSWVRAEGKTAAELFPASTVFYAEIARPRKILDLVLKHPLRERIESLDQYQQAVSGQGYLQFKAVVAIVEAQLGINWQEAVAALTEGGMYVGVDAETEGVALLLNGRDEKSVVKIRDTFINLVRDDARRKGNEDSIKKTQYRGHDVDIVNQAKIAVFDSWLLITNQGELGKRLVDHYLDGGQATLARNEHFQAARKSVKGEPSAWAFANVAALREAGAAKDLFRAQSDNILVELLFGGLQSNLQETPYAGASLFVGQQQVRLGLSVPHDPDWIPEEREYFFGPAGKGAAPAIILPAHGLFSLVTYRDIGRMWLRAGDLFGEGVNDELAKADSNLSTLFAGKDFGEDILSAFGPEIQIVVSRTDFADVLPQPAIKLPAFAMVFRLKDADTMRNELRRIFQSLIGFLNVVGAMNGQPQLDLDMERHGDQQLVISRFVPEPDEQKSREARINFNFSPTVAFVRDQFVISSTHGLARKLADLLASAESNRSQEDVNTLAQADLAELRNVLSDNRNQLVAQNMLTEGNTKEEAERQIDTLLSVAGMFRDVSLKLAADQHSLNLELAVGISGE